MYYKSLLSCFLLFFVFQSFQAKAQNLESLFLQKKYEEIIKISKSKNQANTLQQDEAYWYSLALNQLKLSQQNLTFLEKACLQYPNDTSLKILQAQLYYELGNYKKATPLLKTLAFDKESQLKLARIYEFYGQNTSAINIYQQQLENDKNNLFLTKKIGHNYYKIDSLSQAINYLNLALEIYNEDIESLYLLSKAYEQNKDFDNSANIAIQALNIDSTQTIFLKQAGKSYFQMEDYKQADKYLMKCYKQNDTSLMVQTLFGITNHYLDYNHVAREMLESAYNKDSTNFNVCYFLARVYKALDDYRNSKIFFEKAYELNKANKENLIAYHTGMIHIWKHYEKHHKLYDTFKTLYELTSDPQYIYYMGSTAQFYLKDKPLAYKHYENFLKLVVQKESTEKSKNEKNAISIKEIAKKNYNALKEELFFEGKLKQ